MEEKDKVIIEYLKSIQGNVDRLLSDKADDAREVLNKYSELMLAVSKLSTEVSISNHEVSKLIQSIKGEHKETRELVEGHTKVIIKEVDKAKKRWYQFWKKQ